VVERCSYTFRTSKDWKVNPAQLERVLSILENIKNEFNSAQANGKYVSIAG
jgi:catalase-peroxidase